MKIQLQENFIMKIKAQRDVLPWRIFYTLVDMCAPPSYKYLVISPYQDERMSLCTLKGSLSVEASLIIPFFMMILLAFFSFFSQYASAAKLTVLAAAEAKKIGIVQGSLETSDAGDITIYKTEKLEAFWINPFFQESCVVQHAVCRAWIGFTELESKETYVYITPEGSVYHLYADCSHLDLSIQVVTIGRAKTAKNEYGERYNKCELCRDSFGAMVYITSEGNRYHSKRECGGLKRTIRQVPISQILGRSRCLRCGAREE